MAVAPIPPQMIRRIMRGGHATEETTVEHLAHPLANIAFMGAGLIAIRAMVKTWRERRRG